MKKPHYGAFFFIIISILKFYVYTWPVLQVWEEKI